MDESLAQAPGSLDVATVAEDPQQASSDRIIILDDQHHRPHYLHDRTSHKWTLLPWAVLEWAPFPRCDVDYGSFLRRVGDNLRRARWAAGLTQEEVAALGITYRYYQELERGQRNPTLRTLHMLAEQLHTTVAALCDVEPVATSRAAERMSNYQLKPPPRGRKPGRTRHKAK